MNAVLDDYQFDAHPERDGPARVATPAEVRRAVASLGRADLLRFERFAAWRARALPASEGWRSHEDLLFEAIRLALEGRRLWYPERVSFAGYLLGAIRSVSSNWARAARSAPVALADDEAIAELPAPSEPLDSRLVRAERERAALAALADDPVASRILEDLLDGLTHEEIRRLRGYGERAYQAALKRIRRRVAAGRS